MIFFQLKNTYYNGIPMSVRNKGGVNVGEGSDHDCMLPKTCAKFDKDYIQSLSKL